VWAYVINIAGAGFLCELSCNPYTCTRIQYIVVPYSSYTVPGRHLTLPAGTQPSVQGIEQDKLVCRILGISIYMASTLEFIINCVSFNQETYIDRYDDL